MKQTPQVQRVAVPVAPVQSADPNERMNRIGFYFFMITLGLGVIVAFGSLLFF